MKNDMYVINFVYGFVIVFFLFILFMLYFWFVGENIL